MVPLILHRVWNLDHRFLKYSAEPQGIVKQYEWSRKIRENVNKTFSYAMQGKYERENSMCYFGLLKYVEKNISRKQTIFQRYRCRTRQRLFLPRPGNPENSSNCHTDIHLKYFERIYLILCLNTLRKYLSKIAFFKCQNSFELWAGCIIFFTFWIPRNHFHFVQC